jgi:hypothetical protein
MSLYLLHHDDEPYYVEAESMGDAIALWQAQMMREGVGLEDPQSCTFVDGGAVTRQTTDGCMFCEDTDEDVTIRTCEFCPARACDDCLRVSKRYMADEDGGDMHMCPRCAAEEEKEGGDQAALAAADGDAGDA